MRRICSAMSMGKRMPTKTAITMPRERRNLRAMYM
jgi:hypothetical protein